MKGVYNLTPIISRISPSIRYSGDKDLSKLQCETWHSETRASAQRVKNTPGRRHFLIIKYFKVNDNVIRQDIVYNVSLWVTLIYHPKYNFPGVNSLQDMKQICWAIKYKALTYIHICTWEVNLMVTMMHYTNYDANPVNKNSAEGVIAPAGAKVTGATIRMWLLNKFISFLAVLTWKTGLKKM